MTALEAYKKKRNFTQSPEPEGESASGEPGNRFVIQKHMARREHYDFRIQMGDVLVSWAIPKQPVTDPQIKRLAVKTEDHPVDYIHFEGTIPKGNYGAGTMMVWDYGYYYSADNGLQLSVNELANMIQKGKIKIYLQGQKIKGSFSLVKISKSEKDEWLFMKTQSDTDIDYTERSALTGRTMDEIAAAKPQSDIKEATQDAGKKSTKGKYAEKQEFPGFISPMLATPLENAFSDKDWIYEFKLDGYRLISAKNDDNITLYSRNGNNYNEKYPLIARELKKLKADFVVDGEICYMTNDRPDFQKLQNDYTRQENLHYYVFDILWLNGYDTKDLPLLKRKELLKTLLSDAGNHIHFLEHIEGEGEKFFQEIEGKEMEGIIAKSKVSNYHPGWRSAQWLKIKNVKRQEMIICGYIPSQKNDREFKSLLCGVYSGEKLIYTGKVGTGFGQQKQQKIMSLLSNLITPEAPVENPPKDQDVIWVKAELVCEVKFSEWTTERVMSHPAFIALRDDKAPRQVNFTLPRKEPPSKRKATLSNPDKIFWPEEKIRKRDVYNYY